MSDAVSGLTHACGVFGCVATGPWPTQLDIANVICLGLVGLQHRGQESAGIVTCDGQDAYTIHQHKGMGLVSQIFDEERLAKLKGNLGIGHTRYSTAGGSELTNCQPFVVETLHGRIALAHNGELVNSNPLKQTLLQRGVSFTTNTDSELMTKLLALTPPTCENDGPDWLGRIKQLMTYTATAYALVLMHKDELYAVRDPYGNRPLCIGKLLAKVVAGGDDKPSEEDVEGYVVSSESCSFQSIGAQYYRELLPGEIVRITQHGVESLAVVPTHQGAPTAFCIFEYVYFARADSWFEGQNVYTVRQRLGEQLGREAPVAADLVSTVPESATPAAVGFSKVTGIPYVEVLCKNRYVGRTFIQPSTRLRQLGVTKKFGALSDNFRGKRVVLVDDSIVRGNTMGPIVALLRRSGAKEVHIRIASPPLRHPCYMGINIPTRDELIANRLANTDAALARHLGADSVQYLSVAGLTGAVQQGVNRRLEMGIDKMEGEDENEDEKGQGESASSKTKRGHCVACLTGQYPVSLQW